MSDDSLDPAEAVRRHYEQYPYPHRDPEDERRFIRYTHMDSFACLNHYGFSGRRDFTGFRALVAGGGTGDSTILLAEQLRRTGGRVTHLDLSAPSIDVARRRAAVRGLDNIDWAQGSLLDLERLGLGTFDYVNCSGVLHHLESPEAGLAALTTALGVGGLLGIMLYGKYGRSEYYRMQALMRGIAGDEPDMRRRVELCRKALESGTSPWLVILREGLRRVLAESGDVELYDLFLHSCDRPYVIDEIYDLLEGAGLRLVHLFGDCVEWHGEGNRRYIPESYLEEPGLRERLAGFDRHRRQAIAEILHGRIGQHVFYAAREPRPQPELEDYGNIPFLAQVIADGSYRSLYELARGAPADAGIRCRVFSNIRITFRNTPHAAAFLRYMDGGRTLGEIFERVRGSCPPKRRPALAGLREEFRLLYDAFNTQDLMFLRHASAGREPYMFFDLGP